MIIKFNKGHIGSITLKSKSLSEDFEMGFAAAEPLQGECTPYI